MKHLASPRFWRHYRELPDSVRKIADKNFQLLKTDPYYPSLHLKRIDRLWSVRVGAHYRALGMDAPDSMERLSLWSPRDDRFSGNDDELTAIAERIGHLVVQGELVASGKPTIFFLVPSDRAISPYI